MSIRNYLSPNWKTQTALTTQDVPTSYVYIASQSYKSDLFHPASVVLLAYECMNYSDYDQETCICDDMMTNVKYMQLSLKVAIAITSLRKIFCY